MTVVINGSTGVDTPGLTLGTSVINAPSGSAPSYTCRAWVQFVGTGTVTINGAGNVSSITDLAQADYRVNFTSAMPDTAYSIGSAYNIPSWASYTMNFQDFATSSARIVFGRNGSPTGAPDMPVVCVSFFR